MEYPSDEEVTSTTKLSTENLLKAIEKLKELDKHHPDYIFIDKPHSIPVKNYRDELFYKLLNGWNEERERNGYKPLTAKRLATAINSNPFLKNDDGELAYLIDRCVKAGNYKTASWILFPKKK